jgi:putative flippase GtrA
MVINKKTEQFIKFIISGSVAAIVEYSIFMALDKLIPNGSIHIYQSISFVCGALVSFSLNKYWVFASKGSATSEAVRYFLLVAINTVISNLFLWVMIDKLDMVLWVAKISTMAFIAIWNFLILQKLIFVDKKT